MATSIKPLRLILLAVIVLTIGLLILTPVTTPPVAAARANLDVAKASLTSVLLQAQLHFHDEHDRFGTIDELKAAGAISADFDRQSHLTLDHQITPDGFRASFTLAPELGRHLGPGPVIVSIDHTGQLQIIGLEQQTPATSPAR